MNRQDIQDIADYIYGAVDEALSNPFLFNKINRSQVQAVVNAYLKSLNPPPPITVICDETNNTPEDAAAGKLNVTLVFDPNDPVVQKVINRI